MRLSFKTRLAGTRRRASDARTQAQSQAQSSTEPPQAKQVPGGAREAQPSSRGNYPRAVPGKARQSHADRARLRREKQPREANLGNDEDLAQCGSEHDRAERLLRRRVLLQKRQDLRPEPTASFHHEGRKLRVRVLLRRVPLPLVLFPLARRPARCPGVPLRGPSVVGARVGVRNVDVPSRALVVRLGDVQHGLLELHDDLQTRPVRGANLPELQRSGRLVLLLDPPVPLRDDLLVIHPRQMANTGSCTTAPHTKIRPNLFHYASRLCRRMQSQSQLCAASWHAPDCSSNACIRLVKVCSGG